ncbi:MarR family winged helix-turn-helix transcriptional regulator [Anaerocolumna cellulosilytica]|nr:MarR family transcriptional regulator [Anaerocolumna cellulosilytica]MBB5194193.1 DNA-binding MarR family transcriptional regulator [Anaerocolumna cellulosilytica]
MNTNKEQLNKFLVQVFHDILRLEEAALAKGEFKNLSIHEMHVIEAVYDGNREGISSMTDIAARLMVTASTLTTSVKTLEQKGYLIRTKLTEDKRRVNVTTTDLGTRAYYSHKEFHETLIEQVATSLTPEEFTTLTSALSTLHNFFKQ